MTEEQNKLAEEIECNGINGRDDFSIADKEAIIAALRREPDPVLGECEECRHTIVTPLKRFREREPATEAVRDQVLEEAAKVCDEMPCDCCWHEDAQIMAETCAAAIRALKGKGASQGAGEFVRVPREPTAAQWKAGDEAWADGINAIYRAMIQAAASPDEQKG